jgi:hypothetical protein
MVSFCGISVGIRRLTFPDFGSVHVLLDPTHLSVAELFETYVLVKSYRAAFMDGAYRSIGVLGAVTLES